jgi:hypothetical protein
MQSSPRHQYQFDTSQFPFWLYRLSDKEYSQLRDHSFPIRIEALFLLKLALTRSNSSEELTLPKALVILEHEFGASSIQLDRWKQTFSFPLLLAIEKPNGLFYYLLRITDYRGGIEFDLFRIIDEVNISETRFYQDVLQKGLEQGLQRGEAVGGSPPVGNLVLRLLQRRYGVVSIDDRDLVRSLTITQLESLGDALLDFNGMADLEVWFKANLSPN